MACQRVRYITYAINSRGRRADVAWSTLAFLKSRFQAGYAYHGLKANLSAAVSTTLRFFFEPRSGNHLYIGRLALDSAHMSSI